MDWKPVEQAMGRAGTAQPGGVYRFSFPRSDLQVSVHGIPIKPALALGSHIEFLPVADAGAMVMGDLVLTEDEVNPVLLKLQQGGIDQTALHNHLLGETPRIMYLHLSAQGDPVHLASAIHAALALSGTPLGLPSTSTSAPQDSGLDTKQLDQILGYHGKVNGGVYQVSVPRSETVHDDQGVAIPPAMGVATALNFQATGDGKAAVTGDFVLLGSEVNPVIRVLGENGIDITAVHSHMLTDDPPLFFLHFWGHDDPSKLAHGLRAALDKTNSAQPGT
jgi:hypothetical protein